MTDHDISGERVLVVEDEPATRLGLTELVRTWGFMADSAADEEEARSVPHLLGMGEGLHGG